MKILSSNKLVKGTTLTSRTFQETLMATAGSSPYQSIATFLENNPLQIDQFAKFIGNNAAYFTINTYREAHYHSKDNSAITNFIHRNLYQNPLDSSNYNFKETMLGVSASATTEFAIKKGAEILHDYSRGKANYEALKDAYNFLNNYILLDSDSVDTKRALIELSKIRNSLPLSDANKEKIYTQAKDSNPIPLEDISSMSSLNNDKFCETISYYLFNLFCYKYGDNNGILAEHIENGNFDYPGMDTLLNYYDYLGFTGNHAKELIRTNAINFNKISRAQSTYMNLSRQLIKESSLQIPEINMNDIRQRCASMVQYDPYQLRRKKVQTAGIGAAKALTGIINKRPDIAINGISLALSQFKLEDGNISSLIEKEFKNCGMPASDFSAIEAQAEDLQEKAIQYH